MDAHRKYVIKTMAFVMAITVVSSTACGAQNISRSADAAVQPDKTLAQTINEGEQTQLNRGFAIQPQDVVCSPSNGHGYLDYAFKSMPYRMELLVDGKVYLEWEDENIPKNRISVYDEFDGKELMLRIYYVQIEEGGMPDVYESVPFHVSKGSADDLKILAQPVDPVLSNGVGLATCAVSFTPVQALLYADGEFLRELTVSGDIVNADVTSEDTYKNLTFRIFYGEEKTDYVESEPFRVYSPEDLSFYLQPNSAVLPGDGDVVYVSFAPAFEPLKIQKVQDGKVTYTTSEFHRESNSGNMTFTYGAHEAGTDHVIRAFYGTGEKDYVDSDKFVIVKADENHHFTKQPQDMEVSANGSKPLSWDVDFEPVRQVAVRNGKELTSFNEKEREFDAYDWYMMPSGRYRIRSYYGKGTTDYVESNIFTAIRPEFTVSPVGGYCTVTGTRDVSWQLNFAPAKLELWAENECLEELPKNEKTHTFSASGLEGFQIVAYFDDNERSAIFSPIFNVTGTELPFHEISCDNEVKVYNEQGQPVSNATEGQRLTAMFTGDPIAFKDFKAEDDIIFTPEGAPDMPSRVFTMPTHDVNLQVVYYTGPNNDPQYTLGDANGDGDINVTDIAVVAAHIKGIKALGDEAQQRADVDKSGEINVTDISILASHIKGIKPIPIDTPVTPG